MEINEIISKAESGDAMAQTILASYYENGTDVEKDISKAVELYTSAARKGFAPAQFNLSCLIDTDESIMWLKKAAEQNFAPAQCNLGCYYSDNNDCENAFIQFKAAAENGDRTACFNLAECYENGLGTEKNSELAAYWNSKAQA